MQLKSLQIQNIRSYEDQTITFPQGSTLLSGDIGAGKTTILLAIEFALFGLQPSQKGTSLLKTNQEQAKVELHLEIDNKEIIIERSLKKTKKSVTQDYSSITINQEKFEGSVTEIKSKILKLLNYPPEFAKKTNLLYKFTVYTPQEEMKQIILEPGDIRLNTLRHVFGIDKYKRIEENLSILTSKLREKARLFELITQDIDEEKQNLENKKQNLEDLKKLKTQLTQQHEQALEKSKEKEKALEEVQEKINQKQTLENEKSKSELLIREKSQQITSTKNNISNIQYQLKETQELKFDEGEYTALDQRVKFQESKHQELEKEFIQIVSKINSQDSKKQETESLQNKISHLENCPTCLQEVSENYKQNISQKTSQEIKQLQESINQLTKQRTYLEKQLESIKNSIEEYKKRKSDLEIRKVKLETIKEKQQRIQDLEKQMQATNEDTETLKKHIETIEKSIKEYDKYETIYKTKKEELNQTKTNQEKLAIKKAETNKEIQLLGIQINEVKEKIQKKQEIKTKAEKIKHIESWISNKFLDLILFTEKQVMLSLKQEFSTLFSDWFSTLVSDSLTASLDDDFSPVITQQDYELDYSFLSGGERTAIALAYRLSLNQVINSLLSNIKTSNLVILDEPTDGFSDQQLDKMRDVLHQLNTEQLILVSHEQKIEGFVDNIIRIQKDNGISRIE
ncbi:AAA family ATPase [archaeon]|jgi:DNA repair protein SbcC/Rad50|nr:AAA family ATPase [archaeon]